MHFHCCIFFDVISSMWEMANAATQSPSLLFLKYQFHFKMTTMEIFDDSLKEKISP